MGRKKGGSGAKNGRDSNAKHLGVKAFGGETVKAGSILVRQRGTRIHPGINVKRGKDDTLFAVAFGTVVYHTRRGRKYASISVPAPEPAPAASAPAL